MSISRYPDPPRKALTGEQLQEVTDATVERLHELIGFIDQDTWHEGMTWYFEASRLAHNFGQLFNIGKQHVSAIIAALSPRVNWDANIDDAKLLLETGDEYGYMALGANVSKALWLRDGDNPDKVLGGRKVRSFYRNIYRPTTSLDVTLDAWMMFALDKTLDYKYLERKGTYDAISEGFRIVAGERGIMPHQLQAALWIHVRNKGRTS